MFLKDSLFLISYWLRSLESNRKISVIIYDNEKCYQFYLLLEKKGNLKQQKELALQLTAMSKQQLN